MVAVMARFRPLVLEDLQKNRYRIATSPVSGPKSLIPVLKSEQKTATISFFSVKRKGVAPSSAPKTPILLSVEPTSPALKPDTCPSPRTSPTNLRVSSSLQLLARFRQIDQGIQVKVEETYVSTKVQEEIAFKAKVDEVENSPVSRLTLRKSEGLSYNASIANARLSLPNQEEPPRRRLHSQAAERAPRLSSKARTSLRHSAFPGFPFKSKQDILKDIQQTMERSYEFVHSAQSMSRELSRHFLRAPVMRPKSRVLQN